jgi:hypothetical protein
MGIYCGFTSEGLRVRAAPDSIAEGCCSIWFSCGGRNLRGRSIGIVSYISARMRGRDVAICLVLSPRWRIDICFENFDGYPSSSGSYVSPRVLHNLCPPASRGNGARSFSSFCNYFTKLNQRPVGRYAIFLLAQGVFLCQMKEAGVIARTQG